MLDAIDLFAGPGGWDLAAHDLGMNVLGIEWDAAACQTRRAAGLPTIEGDVRDYGPGLSSRFGPLWADGLIASPPCQTFSMAGKGSGRQALDLVRAIADGMARGELPDPSSFDDERTALVLEPLRWALTAVNMGRPFEWLAFEQVPTVLPVWEHFGAILEAEGYSVATGRVSAEEYGVPQTRKRAVLVARRRHTLRQDVYAEPVCSCGNSAPCYGNAPASLPTPTHSPYRKGKDRQVDGRLPWVSMADALGWTGAEWLHDLDAWRWESLPDGRPRVRDQSGTPIPTDWPEERPSTTVAGRFLVQHPGETTNRHNGSTKTRNDGLRVTPDEAAVLQTFPRGYPWQGSRAKVFEQIGNAIPPLLARAVLSELTGRPVAVERASVPFA